MFDLIQNALTFGRQSAFDSVNKEKWISFATGALQRLSKDLALPTGTFDIRTCKGGNAATGKFCLGVSADTGKCGCKGGSALPGEVILHHKDFFVCLSASSKKDAGYAHRCKDKRDYGGVNRPIPASYEGLLKLCQDMLQEAEDDFFADMLSAAAQ